MKKILDFCEISGSSVKRYEGKRKYIATGDILDNKIISYEEVDYEHKPSRANQNAEIGDVIFAKMQNTKKVIIITKENVNNIYSTGFYVIKPKKNVTSKFLFWLFNSKKFNYDKDKNCKGATQKAINNEGLNKIEIKVLPTIQEQLEIINKLDKAQEIIDIRKEQIKRLDELIKSQFVEMFGDPITNPKNFLMNTIDDIIEFQGGSQPDKKYFEYTPNENNIRLIQIRDYKTDDFITYIPRNLAKRFCEKDDIMIGRYGPPIFQILQGIEGAYNVALMKAIPKKGNKEFIRYFLKQECLLKYLEGLSQRTAGQAGIEMPKLKKYPFPYPPIDLQNKFAEFVKQVDKQKFELQKSLEEMQKLQESLINIYFNLQQ